MRPSLLFLLLASAGALWYSRRPVPISCAQPVHWSLAALDQRFGVTRDAAISDAEAATEIWSRAAGKTLFAYDPSAPLTVALIYDTRQENVLTRSKLAAEEASQDSIRSGLEALKESYQTRRDLYNRQVGDVNVRGGATAVEAQLLTTEKESLQSLSDSIRRAVDAFNARNRLIDAEVARFNERGAQSVVEGRYVEDRRGHRIEAFAFIGDSGLTRLLAHEFGHALGLGHNHDPESIMYEKNESGSLTPSAADLASLRRVCGP